MQRSPDRSNVPYRIDRLMCVGHPEVPFRGQSGLRAAAWTKTYGPKRRRTIR